MFKKSAQICANSRKPSSHLRFIFPLRYRFLLCKPISLRSMRSLRLKCFFPFLMLNFMRSSPSSAVSPFHPKMNFPLFYSSLPTFCQFFPHLCSYFTLISPYFTHLYSRLLMKNDESTLIISGTEKAPTRKNILTTDDADNRGWESRAENHNREICAHQPARRRGVRRQPRRLSGDAALAKALEVRRDLEMRKRIPARKRCQPHSPPATALHDAIALNGAFRRFMVPMRGKLAVEVSHESKGPSPHHGRMDLQSPHDPHPALTRHPLPLLRARDNLPSHPMGAERGPAFAWQRRDRSVFVALRCDAALANSLDLCYHRSPLRGLNRRVNNSKKGVSIERWGRAINQAVPQPCSFEM